MPTEEQQTLSNAAVVGISIATIFLILAISILTYFLYRRRNKVQQLEGNNDNKMTFENSDFESNQPQEDEYYEEQEPDLHGLYGMVQNQQVQLDHIITLLQKQVK